MRGEFELIASFRERIAAAGAATSERLRLGSGDDAAITTPAAATATTVDAVVDGVHFRRTTFPPHAIGAKALAAALSDLAAMGVQPGEAYVQVGVPEDMPEADLLLLADGLGALAADAGVAIAGGDLTASPVLFLAVTCVGHAAGADRPVSRGGARAQDAVLVTGPLGGAAAGLLLLERPGLADGLPVAVADDLRRRQLEPVPRIEAGRALAGAGVSALIDLSDGLAGDAAHVASASGVRMAIELDAVPAADGVVEVAAAAGADATELIAGGGEDYELLACVASERLDDAVAAVQAAGLDPAVVGVVEAGEGVVLRDPRGREIDVRGFDQLRARALSGPA